MQVRKAGRTALLAMSGSGVSASAGSGTASAASLQAAGAEAEVASANGGAEHTAVQMTPLGQTVGLKRKRLQNGK